MKRRPNAAVGLAITHQRDLFWIDLRNSQRVHQEEQLLESLAGHEGIEISGALRRQNVGEFAQFLIVVQVLAEELLIIAIEITRLAGLRTAGAKFRTG